MSMDRKVGHGTIVDNSQGNRITFGDENGGTAYSLSRTQKGHYEGSDTSGNKYAADYNEEDGLWYATKTDLEGNQYEDELLVKKTGDATFDVFDDETAWRAKEEEETV